MAPRDWGFWISNFFAGLAERLRLTDRNFVIRWSAIFAFCLLPFSLALLDLPEFIETRHRLTELSNNSVTSAVFNPVVALIAVIITLFAVISINRGWARSEQQRAMLVFKSQSDPAVMPTDLRGAALLSAVILIFLIPALLFYSNELSCQARSIGCLFSGPTQNGAPWFATSADIAIQTVTFSIPQEILRYSNFSSVVAASGYGRILELVVRALVQTIFVASIFELFRIYGTILAAVDALRMTDRAKTKPLSPHLLQLGPRLVPRLCRVLRNSLDGADNEMEDPDVFAHNAANAIGQIGDVRAIPTLKNIFRQRSLKSWPRQRALMALAKLADTFKQKKALGGLQSIWSGIALLRLRLWSWIWIKKEGWRAQRTGRPEMRVRNALEELFRATYNQNANAAS